MQEHERKDYQRLRAEGRWPQASEFREAERQRLRAEGRNKQQARDESWAAMLVKFPPLEGGRSASEPTSESPSPSVDPNTLPDVIFAEDANYKQAVRWAFRAIGLDPDKIPSRQIPDAASLEMLRFAQTEKGRERFFLWVKQLDDEDAESQQAKKSFKDDQRTHFELIARVREYHLAKQQQHCCPTCQGRGSIPQDATA